MATNTAVRDTGSFRDPAGFVYADDGRIFRAITKSGIERWHAVEANSVLAGLRQTGSVIEHWPAVDATILSPDIAETVEHPPLPIISYPYEWCFAMLQAAALHHLKVHLALLEGDITLVDASAYNIQFIGARPIFIDALSFEPYVAGRIWAGHRQFVEQFLCPLLLPALTGVPANAFYRGNLEGLPAADLKRLAPMRARFSWRFLKHVILPTMLNKLGDEASSEIDKPDSIKAGLPKASLLAILQDLERWITSLRPKGVKTTWGDYGLLDSYDEAGREAKLRAVQEFSATVKPAKLWDIGCNNGAYTAAALEAGAGYAVGWDADENAVNQAFARAQKENLQLTPLLADLANPSPGQGWGEAERSGFAARADADAVIALALVHHLSIGRNVPLIEVGRWLSELASTGLVEFVPKADPQVQRMLKLRQDIFQDYTLEALIKGIESRGRIERRIPLGSGGRELLWFKRAAG